MVQTLAKKDGKNLVYDQHTNGGWTWELHAASAVSFLYLSTIYNEI